MEFFRIRRDIPFMRHALVFNVISLVTFLAAVFFLATRGLHFSIEFTGGTLIETTYAQAADIPKIRATVDRLDLGDVQVQNFGSSREAVVASAQFLSKDASLMLSLLSDALLRPRMDQAEFDKLRKRAIDGLASAKDSDPRQLIGIYGNAWLFRGHPYGRPTGGDETSLAHIVANEVGVALHITSGPALERGGDLAAILSQLGDGDVLFIDEIHRLARPVEKTADGLRDFGDLAGHEAGVGHGAPPPDRLSSATKS